MTRGSRIEEREGAAGGENGLVAGILAAMPHADTRWSRGERCGCFLIALGSGFTFFGLTWTAMDGYYAESGRLAEAVLFAWLAAGGLGLVLVFWLPKA